MPSFHVQMKIEDANQKSDEWLSEFFEMPADEIRAQLSDMDKRGLEWIPAAECDSADTVGKCTGHQLPEEKAPEKKITMYFGGTSGIEKPVDFLGHEIKPGDILSWDFADNEKGPVEWMLKPIYKVAEHESGEGLYAHGIDKDLYLHDFRFEYCIKIHERKQGY